MLTSGMPAGLPGLDIILLRAHGLLLPPIVPSTRLRLTSVSGTLFAPSSTAKAIWCMCRRLNSKPRVYLLPLWASGMSRPSDSFVFMAGCSPALWMVTHINSSKTEEGIRYLAVVGKD